MHPQTKGLALGMALASSCGGFAAAHPEIGTAVSALIVSACGLIGSLTPIVYAYLRDKLKPSAPVAPSAPKGGPQ